MSLLSHAGRNPVETVPKRLFSAGEWRDSSSGNTFAIENPASGEAITDVSDATPQDEPTVLAGVPADAMLLREEIFGPVAPIRTFASDDEAIAAANATEYGLVSYVFTRDLARAARVVDELDTGMIGLNRGIVSTAGAPFGGVKQSGIGREGGPEGIEEYLETKYVARDRSETLGA